MKKLAPAFALLIILLSLTACTSPSPSETPTQEPPASQPPVGSESLSGTQQGYPFQSNGQNIYVCMEAAPLLAALPEPDDVFESPSCAFDGVDITYFYPGFELTTYPDGDKEYVLSVSLTDDSVTTPEGLYIGSTVADMEAAYGTGYTQSGIQYTYREGEGSLVISTTDDTVTGIIYLYDVG